MANSKNIPPSLKHFKDYHDKNYQKLLSIPGLNLHIMHEVEKFLKELVSESDFCMRVHLNSLSSIIQKNEIMSCMEIGGGATIGGKEVRKKTTQALFNADTTTLKDNEYPKFGYLGVKRKIVDLISNGSMGYQYGELIITFKKNTLMERTTMTVGSSLNWGECYRKTPTFTDSPKAVCIKTFSRLDTPAEFRELQFDVGLKAIYVIYDAIVHKELTTTNPFKIEDIFNGLFGFEFFELQYHGKLIFNEVVERVDFYPISNEDKKSFENLCKTMKKMKVDYYRLEF